MLTIGLIGGLSWHSTLEYYRLINERVAERRGGHASARIVLESLDFSVVRECQVAEDWSRAGSPRPDTTSRRPVPTSS
jgi:aspartate racemase